MYKTIARPVLVYGNEHDSRLEIVRSENYHN
jgi:hypothetical protein